MPRYLGRRLLVLAAVLAAGATAPAALASPVPPATDIWGRALQSLEAVQLTDVPDLAERAAVSSPPVAAAPATPKTDTSGQDAAGQPMPRKKWVTPSRYVQTTAPSVIRQMGCHAGRLHTNGIVVLAFGKQAYNGHTYGTILFSDRFAGNAQITTAMKAYATGYAKCLPGGGNARITLVRGTSNYSPSVPKTVQSGLRWSREVKTFADWLTAHPAVGDHVSSAAGIDAEPAWDPAFRRTYGFFAGYRQAGNDYPLYNFGSLDGGVGAIWNLRQAFYVSGGMQYARVLPEIYFPQQVDQWAELARMAIDRYGRPVQFAGLMTQHWTNCHGCGFTAPKAHRLLQQALASAPSTRDQVRMLASATNIN